MKRLFVACSLLASMVWAPLTATAADDPYSLEAAVRAYPASAPIVSAVPVALDPRDRAAVDYQLSQDAAYLKIIFVISGVAIAFLLFTLWLSRGPLSDRDVLRSAVVVFIAYGGIVLALAYPKNETMTGVIGILSAIAGYVFGRSTGEVERQPKPVEQTGKT
jgi:hypothetical protein